MTLGTFHLCNCSYMYYKRWTDEIADLLKKNAVPRLLVLTVHSQVLTSQKEQAAKRLRSPDTTAYTLIRNSFTLINNDSNPNWSTYWFHLETKIQPLNHSRFRPKSRSNTRYCRSSLSMRTNTVLVMCVSVCVLWIDIANNNKSTRRRVHAAGLSTPFHPITLYPTYIYPPSSLRIQTETLSEN